MKAADGSLPLHLACLYSGPVDLPVIRYLLLLHPDAVDIPDGHGLLPQDIVHDNVVDFRVKKEILECLRRTAAAVSTSSGDEQEWQESQQQQQEQQQQQDLLQQQQGNQQMMSTIAMDYSINAAVQTQNCPAVGEKMHLHTKKCHCIEQIHDKDQEPTKVVETKQCVVCMGSQVSRLLVPCGHPGNFSSFYYFFNSKMYGQL